GRVRLWRADDELGPAVPQPAALVVGTPLPSARPRRETELLDLVPEGLMVCDPDGLVAWANGPLAALYGLASPEQAVGPSSSSARHNRTRPRPPSASHDTRMWRPRCSNAYGVVCVRWRWMPAAM
ncbi:MAG: PAS domain-containing protein, partial [Comamonadaceae bacterium]